MGNPSREQITKAFELWETRYRNEPADFLTAEESTAMEVSDVSEQRAIYLIALLREVA